MEEPITANELALYALIYKYRKEFKTSFPQLFSGYVQIKCEMVLMVYEQMYKQPENKMDMFRHLWMIADDVIASRNCIF